MCKAISILIHLTINNCNLSYLIWISHQHYISFLNNLKFIRTQIEILKWFQFVLIKLTRIQIWVATAFMYGNLVKIVKQLTNKNYSKTLAAYTFVLNKCWSDQINWKHTSSEVKSQATTREKLVHRICWKFSQVFVTFW